MRYDPRESVHFSFGHVNFYYTPVTRWGYLEPELVMKSVGDILSRFELTNVSTVWIPQVGWELWSKQTFLEAMEQKYPEYLRAQDSLQDSRKTVLALDAKRAARLGDALTIQHEAMRWKAKDDSKKQLADDLGYDRAVGGVIQVEDRYKIGAQRAQRHCDAHLQFDVASAPLS